MVQQSRFLSKKIGLAFTIICIAGAFLATSGSIPIQAQPLAPDVTYVGSNITTDTTWTLADSPYYITSDVEVSNGATLTIEPGVQVWIGWTRYLKIRSGSAVIAKGTPSQHITITRYLPHEGPRWKKIWFYENSSSYLRYVDVSYGGTDSAGDDAILKYDGPGTHVLNNCTISQSKQQGVVAIGNGLNLTVAGTEFYNNGRRSIMVDTGANLIVTGGSTFRDVNDAAIYLRERPIVATVTVDNSNFVSGVQQGVANMMDDDICVNAQYNWWNHSSGPAGGGNGACGIGSNGGSGTPLGPGVDYRHYLSAEAPRTGITTDPVANFSVTPDPIGSLPPTTEFTFDASGSTDVEDYTSSLEFCWDWENSGTCNTWLTTPSTTHTFSSGGMKTVRLVVRDTDGDTDEATRDIQLGYPPTAAFVYTQTTWSEVVFDASSSSDVEDDVSALLAQWDWGSDGSWDTSAISATMIQTYTYPHLGRFWPELVVEDTDGLTDTVSKAVDIIPVVKDTSLSGHGGTLVSEDLTVQIDVYTDTVTSNVISNGLTITHTPWLTLPYSGLEGLFTYQGFNLMAESLGQPITQVNGTYTITVYYPFTYFTDIVDLPPFESQLTLYHWSDDTSSWDLVDFALNMTDDQLIATTDSFGEFALVMDAKRVYLPLVMRQS